MTDRPVGRLPVIAAASSERIPTTIGDVVVTGPETRLVCRSLGRPAIARRTIVPLAPLHLRPRNPTTRRALADVALREQSLGQTAPEPRSARFTLLRIDAGLGRRRRSGETA
jgi:hypothetical protein